MIFMQDTKYEPEDKGDEDTEGLLFKGLSLSEWKTKEDTFYRYLNWDKDEEAMEIMSELITILKEMIDCSDYIAYFGHASIKSYFFVKHIRLCCRYMLYNKTFKIKEALR